MELLKWERIKMSVIQSEVFEALRAIYIPEEKALKAAASLSKRDEDVISVKAELLLIKWMIGFVLAFQVAIFAKLFMH
jgi:hypothetical protein